MYLVQLFDLSCSLQPIECASVESPEAAASWARFKRAEWANHTPKAVIVFDLSTTN